MKQSGFNAFWGVFGIAFSFLMASSAMAGTLSNTSIDISDNTANATASYTFTYTTETEVTDSDLLLFFVFNSNFEVLSSECVDLTITVDGNSKACGADTGDFSNYGKLLQIDEVVPAGSDVVVTIDNVKNPDSGEYDFTILRTTTSSGAEIDSWPGSPSVAIVGPATVSTLATSSIGVDSATLNGNVTDDGANTVTARGFVYSTTDTTPQIGETGVTNVTDGSGTGMFNENVTGLTASTTYYYQAYATNSVDTSYGGVQNFTTNSPDSDGNLTTAAGVTEPVGLDSTIDSAGEAVNGFDFTLSDGGNADGLAMTVSQIVVNVSGSSTDAERGQVTWRLNGNDAANVTGTYNAGSDTITFSGLSISIADGANEIYTINAYYNDNSNLTDGNTFILSVDGDTDVTVGGAGTQMGTTSPITNGSGTTVDVTATQLAFTTQPTGSVSGNTLTTQPVVAAQDAFGNTDTDFAETITLMEGSAGSLSGDVDVAAVSGVATFSNVIYTATADQQSFTLTANDEDGTDTNLPTVDAGAVTSDVVATQLVFDTQPAPLSVNSGESSTLTTVPVVSAQDANNMVDTGYSTDITLSEVNGAGSATMTVTSDRDGSVNTVTVTPSSGVATFSGMEITFTAAGGSTNFNLQASSGGLSNVDSSVLSAFVNTAPTSSDNTVTTDEDTAHTFSASDFNYSDVDNDALAKVRIDVLPAEGSLTLMGNAVSVNDEVTATLLSSGRLQFTPAANESGSPYDSFTFRVNDGTDYSASSSTLTIDVTSVNDVPEISGSPATEVLEDSAYSFVPTATDSDANDELTFIISNRPSWASFDSTTGSLTGTPTNADVGTTTNIVISVEDGNGGSESLAAFNLTVTNVNDAPVGQSVDVSTEEDTSITIAPSIIDPDEDVLELTVMATSTNGTLNLSGLGWHYQPDKDFNGSDQFTYEVSDGELTSDSYTVSIQVTPVNDAPLAEDDSFTLDRVDNNRYTLDVLANDMDVDSDALRIGLARTNLGEVSVESEQLVYQATNANFSGTVEIEYTALDGQGGQDKATVQLTLVGENAAELPTLTVPEDVEVNATALFTQVDLGTAEATDAEGNPLAVSFADDEQRLLFPPGEHQVFWQTTDNNGNTVTESQTVRVKPLVSLSKDQTRVEGNLVTVRVILNGDAPSYPLTVPYSVSGTASSGDDHTLESGSVTIERGRQALIEYSIIDDGIADDGETVVITLDEALNLGAQSSQMVTISEQNVAPSVSLSVEQNSQTRLTVSQDQDLVTVIAEASDVNEGDTLTLDWQSDLNNQATQAEQFIFDPAAVATGVYEVTVAVTDDGTPELSKRTSVFIEVTDTLAALSADNDADGDLISDEEEGFKDSDGDGIPDYLDNINDCNVVPEQLMEGDRFLAEGAPGVCLRKGRNAAVSETGGLQLTAEEISSQLGEDVSANNAGGVFDFILYDLPEAGESVNIVIPQARPIPANAIYRKFTGEQWVDFVEDDNNVIFSAAGQEGFCPPPGASEWQQGLVQGHHCVQLLIEDGGPNDADGEVNSAIDDPGGVAVPANSNALPEAVDDNVETPWQQAVEVDVVSNDTDADGDALSLTSVTADIGQVELVDEVTLRYTPPANFSGKVTVNYGIEDGNQGTDTGRLMVTVLPNRAPVTVDDAATTDHQTAIIVDVLANDNDPDGDNLSLVSATASVGSADVSNGLVVFTPEISTGGNAIVSYLVKDQYGAESQGRLVVTVDGNTAPVAVNDSTSTDDRTVITIDVLSNDIDANGDTLTITEASAEHGVVNITNNKLDYVPPSGFDGQDTITYTVSDGFGGIDQGMVTVTVSAYDTITVTNKSSGGGGLWLMQLLLLVMIGWRARQRMIRGK